MTNFLFHRILDKYRLLDLHTLEVLRNSSASLVVKIGGMGVGLLVSLFLGRTIGANGLGVINLANQIISLFLTLAFLGFSKVIIKEIAIAYDKGQSGRVKDVLYTTFIINGLVSFICTILLIFYSEKLSNDFFKIPQLQIPLIIVSIVFVPQIVSRILSAALIGFKKIWQSNLVDQTLSVFVTGIILVFLWLFNVEITVMNVAIAYGIGRLTVTLAITLYWLYLNRKNKNPRKPIFIGKEMIASGLPLLIVSASLLVSSNADTLMLGWLGTAKEVGLYNIAARLALLTSFVLQIAVSSIGPKIAVMYENGQINELKVMLQKVTLGLTFIGFLPLIIFIVFGKYILNMWGGEFVSAYPALVALSVGQFFNIASGPVGYILIMTNHEKLIRNITIFTVLLNVLLNYILISKYGSFGAAFATSFTTILNMIICYYFVRNKLGLNFIGFLKK